MRLFLHGRTASTTLQNRLNYATTSNKFTSLLLSGWNGDDDEKQTVIRDLCSYISEQTSSFKEVTLVNCIGNLRQLVATIVKSTLHLTIRFDKEEQNTLPRSITDGLALAATISKTANRASNSVRLQSLSLCGITLSQSTVKRLQHALFHYQIESLSFQGRFLLTELDKNSVSILGETSQDDTVFPVMDGLVRLISDMSDLKHLELENCHIADAPLAQLLAVASLSCNKLSTLKLRGNICQQKSTAILSHWLKQPDCPLLQLDLSWQREPWEKYGHLMDLPMLAESLAHNTSLQILKLSDNQLIDSHVAWLAKALVQNTTLQHLELQNCRIDEMGALALANHLPQYSLRYLDLNGNQQTKLGKSLLLVPLSKNVALEHLVLPRPSKRLEFLLEWNRVGRRVVLREDYETNGFPTSLWPRLLERANHIGEEQPKTEEVIRHQASTIYYLLRETKGRIPLSNNRHSRQQ